jgi:hypothetical protein
MFIEKFKREKNFVNKILYQALHYKVLFDLGIALIRVLSHLSSDTPRGAAKVNDT